MNLNDMDIHNEGISTVEGGGGLYVVNYSYLHACDMCTVSHVFTLKATTTAPRTGPGACICVFRCTYVCVCVCA